MRNRCEEGDIGEVYGLLWDVWDVVKGSLPVEVTPEIRLCWLVCLGRELAAEHPVDVHGGRRRAGHIMNEP